MFTNVTKKKKLRASAPVAAYYDSTDAANISTSAEFTIDANSERKPPILTLPPKSNQAFDGDDELFLAVMGRIKQLIEIAQESIDRPVSLQFINLGSSHPSIRAPLISDDIQEFKQKLAQCPCAVSWFDIRNGLRSLITRQHLKQRFFRSHLLPSSVGILCPMMIQLRYYNLNDV